MRPLVRFASIAIAVVLLGSTPGTAVAKDGAQGQYFPEQGQRGGQAAPAATAFETPPRPVRVGIGLNLGSHIPVRQEFGTLGERFTPTFDIGGGIFMNVQGMFEAGFEVHGLAGGLETEPWENAFGLVDPSSRHLWLGLRARLHPVAFGQLRPMISVAYGGNRVAVIEERGTGVFECRDNGWNFRCEEETERTFTGGYWGQTFALGGGLRVDPRGPAGISFVAEALYAAQRYGRQTASIGDPIRLESAGPVVHEVMVSAGIVFLF